MCPFIYNLVNIQRCEFDKSSCLLYAFWRIFLWRCQHFYGANTLTVFSVNVAPFSFRMMSVKQFPSDMMSNTCRFFDFSFDASTPFSPETKNHHPFHVSLSLRRLRSIVFCFCFGSRLVFQFDSLATIRLRSTNMFDCAYIPISIWFIDSFLLKHWYRMIFACTQFSVSRSAAAPFCCGSVRCRLFSISIKRS